MVDYDYVFENHDVHRELKNQQNGYLENKRNQFNNNIIYFFLLAPGRLL